MTESTTVWCKIRAMLIQILAPLSLTTVCFAAIDQFFSTNPIFYIRQWSTYKTARLCTCIAACFWIIHSISSGIFINSYMKISCYSSDIIFIRYQLYFYYPMLLGILPMSISSMFSLLAFRNVRRIIRHQIPIIRRRLDRQMTTLVFTRVIVLVILYLPYIGYYMFSFYSSFDRTNYIQLLITYLIGAIPNSFVLLNNAITFYIFLAVSPRYRRQVKHLVVKKLWRQCKQCDRFSRNQINPSIEKIPDPITNIV